MKCTYCLKTLADGPLHRTTPKGTTPAGWACTECCEKYGCTIDPETKEFTEEIHRLLNPKNGHGKRDD